jgi:hypothetical protein
MKATINEYMKAKGPKPTKEKLVALGFQSVSAIPPEHYAKVYAEFSKLD